MEEKLQELLKMEDVDVLPYMDWQLTQEVTLDLDDKDKWVCEWLDPLLLREMKMEENTATI